VVVVLAVVAHPPQQLNLRQAMERLSKKNKGRKPVKSFFFMVMGVDK